MSIEFNRRTFLKTGAVLVGATALVGLTGCDSSSSSSHSINKKVGNNTYNVGGIIVDPQSNVGIGVSSYQLFLTLTNSTDTDITIYPNNFDATYKNTSAPIEATDENGNFEIKLPAKTASAAAPECDVYLDIPMIGNAQNTTDCVFLFSYNGKSIAFQSKNDELYTSDVFTDKIKF